MNRKFTKSIISILLALILAIASVSITAFAEGESEIFVDFMSESADSVTAVVKLKNPNTNITVGALFLEYDNDVLIISAEDVDYQAGKIGTIIGEGENEGRISLNWMFNPPIEASNEYTPIAEAEFIFKEGKTLADLSESSFSVCSNFDFLNACGQLGGTGGATLAFEDNKYNLSNDDITVRFGDIPEPAPKTVAVTDVDITLDGALASNENATVITGETLDFNAPVYPSNATDTSVRWTSSNTAVATIDEDGVVTALTAGTTTITVTTNDGGFTDTCTVTVRAAAPQKAIKSLADATATTTVGTAPTLPTTVTATYDDDETGSVNVTWDEIDAEDYAEKGTFEVKGTVAGTNIKAKCIVTVNEKAPEAKKIDKIAPVEVSTFIGSVAALPEKVTVTYSDKSTESVKVTWDSVSADKYTEKGSFEIDGTVAGTNIKAKCTVKVKDPKEIVSIKTSEVSTKVSSVPTLPKTVTVTYADKTTGTVDVTWETIDSAALSKAGTFTVHGTVKGTDIAAECKITVKKGSNGDPDKNDTPKTGDSVIGVAIAGLIFLASMMIMFMCAGAIKKHQPVKQSSANLQGIGGLMRFAPKPVRSRGRNQRYRGRYNINRNNRRNCR